VPLPAVTAIRLPLPLPFAVVRLPTPASGSEAGVRRRVDSGVRGSAPADRTAGNGGPNSEERSVPPRTVLGSKEYGPRADRGRRKRGPNGREPAQGAHGAAASGVERTERAGTADRTPRRDRFLGERSSRRWTTASGQRRRSALKTTYPDTARSSTGRWPSRTPGSPPCAIDARGSTARSPAWRHWPGTSRLRSAVPTQPRGTAPALALRPAFR
jgi:hypothetical protein